MSDATTPPPPTEAAAAVTEVEQNWALGAHLAAIAFCFTGFPFVGALVVYFLKGRQSAFIRSHSLEALNFTVTVFVVGFVGALSPLAIVVIPALFIAVIVLSILGAQAARDTKAFRYPLTWRVIK